nr:TIGR02996 domain-containing protein [Kofleriaceae bacterium]
MIERQLLARIAESPDDLAPRLVYADWLDEHGRGDRARTIRVECGLDAADVPAWDPRRADRAAVDEPERWPDLPDGVAWMRSRRRGGFCEGIDGRPAIVLARAAELAATWPLRALTIQADREPLDLDALIAMPIARQLDALTLVGGALGPDAIARLCELPRLTSLGLIFDGVTAAGLHALVRSPLMPRLRALDLTNDFRDDLGRPIRDAFDGIAVPTLRALTLAHTGVAAVSTVLAACPPLRYLGLSGVQLRERGWRALAGAALPAWLDARGTGVVPMRAVHAFRDRANVAAVRNLDLGESEIGLAALRVLAGMTWPALERLDLRWTSIGAAGVEVLAASADRFPRLVRVDARQADLPPAVQAVVDRWRVSFTAP